MDSIHLDDGPPLNLTVHTFESYIFYFLLEKNGVGVVFSFVVFGSTSVNTVDPIKRACVNK